MLTPTDADRLAARNRPEDPVILRQHWKHLLFLHWKWDPAAVQLTLPPGLTVDVFGGHAWLAITPFFMRDVRPPLCPVVPGLSHFLECNVRTYVFDAQGRPGVWFYSLDANHWLAVKLARAWFHLPYQHAAMTATVDPMVREVNYAVCRAGTAEESRFRYRLPETGKEAAVGSLEFFLLERYRLFAQHDNGPLLTARVAHAPYRIASAEVARWDDGLLQLAGFDPGGRAPDHLCVTGPVDVEGFSPERVEAKAAQFAREPLGEQAMPA